jgi:hypothetical protein
MNDEEFPCRTKTIGGTRYTVHIWRGKTKRGKPSGMTSFDTEKQAKSFCEGLAHHPYYEITPYHWSQKICIECGQESDY